MVLVIRITICPCLHRICLCLLLLVRRLWYGYPFRRIPLTQRRYAIVDPADYPRLAQYNWHANRGRTTFYAQRKKWLPALKKEVTVKMHRQVLNVPGYLLVDHINGNGLDNRRANLRPATHSQNSCNTPACPGSRSKFRGVTWHNARRRWYARIRSNRRTISLGYFDNDRAAARAYDLAARRYHGQFARPNFPDC